MFKVTLHIGEVRHATLHNMLGKLDFGYERLAAIADYKAELFTSGMGSHGLTTLESYPRWSVSIWDLIARLVARGLYLREELPPIPCEATSKPGAYATRMCAIVEHWSELAETRRARIGTAQIAMEGRKCDYVCELQDDLLGERRSQLFRHAPEVLQHWDLLVRAVCWTDTGQYQLPPRPPLRLARPFEEGGKSYVALGKVPQPARAGLEQWLARQGVVIAKPADAPSGIVAEDVYNYFMTKVL